MSLRKLDQTLVNWQVAPAEFELSNYDEPKLRYRKMVENFIKSLPIKSIKKKIFYTISTNVLCADIKTSKDTIDPIDRDIYLPLEISLTKWSIRDANEPIKTRALETKLWMINPGPPTKLCNSIATDHKAKHKIEFEIEQTIDSTQQNPYVESDLNKIVKEINSFLSADRTVFSISLKHCRQDLGSLKWLNQKTNYKTKPVSVLSMEDLYVVLIRLLCPEFKTGLAIAEYRLSCNCDSYNPKLQCEYHRNKSKNEQDGETPHCAMAISRGYSNVIIDDISMFSSRSA